MSLTEAQAVIAQGYPRLCTPDEAYKFARYTARAMPTGEGTDAEIWLKDATIIFSEYAEADVKKAVEHPTKGFRAKSKWLPVASEMIEFLNAMRERRGRILTNAKHVVAELTKEPEQPRDTVADANMARCLENLSREISGKRSLEAVEATREAQAQFVDEALAAGGGDYQRGIEILMGIERAGAPDTWKIE